MSDAVEHGERSPARRWRPVMVAALLLLAYLIVPGRDDPPPGGSPAGPLSALSGDTPQPPASPSSTLAEDVSSTAADSSAPGPDSPSRASDRPPRSVGRLGPAPQVGITNLQAWKTPLRLGLVVPTSGPLAREGTEVREVVQRRVEAANASGGVAGVPIELVIASAEDQRAIEAMAATVTAIVGGFGAEITTATPWLFPADPTVTGPNVVPAERSARSVGAQLASDLQTEGLLGVIGVIVGTGPDSALAAGLASRSNVTTVTARKNTTCENEIATLRRAGAITLAVAGDSDLAASCVRAASDLPWQPRRGPLVAPSAAYAGVASLPEATGVRTVLALPWPTSPASGAARFRATTTSQSYRALVSYAATELAIDVARQTGTLSLASMTGRIWRSDLLELEGTTNRSGSISSAILGTWVAVP
ncbi:MAG: ABC transporter substrate-binding protein [Acidimicrobiales bacterium]